MYRDEGIQIRKSVRFNKLVLRVVLMCLLSVKSFAQPPVGVKYGELETTTLQIESSQAQRYQTDAERWGLSLEEWMRYLEIKAGPRGMWSPGLDPIAYLALEAETIAEQRHYAIIYAHMQDRRIRSELRIDRFRREEVKKIYQSKKTFDQDILGGTRANKSNLRMLNKSILSSPADALLFGDRLLYFVDVSLSPKAQVQILVSKIDQYDGVGLDIYVAGAKDDNEIMVWAQEMGIDRDRVESGLVSLNHENGALKKISKDNSTSQLYLSREDKIHRVKSSAL